MKVQFTMSVGVSASRRSEVVDLEGDMTDAEIEEAYIEWRNNYLDGTWTKLQPHPPCADRLDER